MIGYYSYLSAAIGFGFLTILLLFSWRSSSHGRGSGGPSVEALATTMVALGIRIPANQWASESCGGSSGEGARSRGRCRAAVGHGARHRASGGRILAHLGAGGQRTVTRGW